MAVMMRLDGRTPDQIAENLGVQRRTVYLWFSDPLVKAELESEHAQLSNRLREKIATAAVAAVDALREMIATPIEGPISDEARLAAMREVFTRIDPEAFHPPPREGPSPELQRQLAELTPAERKEFVREAIKRLLGITDEQLEWIRDDPDPHPKAIEAG
jgi:AcrR family transcriptional regulator